MKTNAKMLYKKFLANKIIMDSFKEIMVNLVDSKEIVYENIEYFFDLLFLNILD